MRDLRVDQVTVRYGQGSRAVTVLDRVSLSIPTGSTLGLVGESGSGKSTLARAIVGLVPLAKGRVLLGDAPVAGRRGQPGPIQMVFQNPYASLDPKLTVGAAIGEALPGRSAREVGEAVERYLDLLGLEPSHAGQYPHQLSGGQRQRVAIARALAAEPEVLVADEITSALDVSVQAAILNLIGRLQKQLGLTLLFISHNIAAVRYLCDRIAVMHAGRIVETGPSEEITSMPAHAYTRTLLDAVPRIDAPSVPRPWATQTLES